MGVLAWLCRGLLPLASWCPEHTPLTSCVASLQSLGCHRALHPGVEASVEEGDAGEPLSRTSRSHSWKDPVQVALAKGRQRIP